MEAGNVSWGRKINPAGIIWSTLKTRYKEQISRSSLWKDGIRNYKLKSMPHRQKEGAFMTGKTLLTLNHHRLKRNRPESSMKITN